MIIESPTILPQTVACFSHSLCKCLMHFGELVEPMRIELTTFALRTRRSPN